MKLRRVSMPLATALVLVLVLASCGGRQQQAQPEASGPPPQEKPVIGAILMQQDQFFRLNEAGMRAAAEALGADLRVQNAAGALDKEITLVETFMTQDVDAILVSPLSSQASVPALQRAHEKGIEVVAYNNSLDAGFPAFSIASDQQSLGSTSGAAAKAWVDARLGGTARVALIGFASQLPEQGGARAAGFKQAIAGPGIEIVAEQDAWEAPQAERVVGELLAKKPDVVWAANEGGTVGAVTAVRNAGLAGQVAVFGTDVSTQLLDFLASEDGILKAVTAQAPVDMGRQAVEAAVKAVRGEALPSASVTLKGVLYSRDRPDELAATREALQAASR